MQKYKRTDCASRTNEVIHQSNQDWHCSIFECNEGEAIASHWIDPSNSTKAKHNNVNVRAVRSAPTRSFIDCNQDKRTRIIARVAYVDRE